MVGFGGFYKEMSVLVVSCLVCRAELGGWVGGGWGVRLQTYLAWQGWGLVGGR